MMILPINPFPLLDDYAPGGGEENNFNIFELVSEKFVSLKIELTKMRLLNNNWWWQILPATAWR
jgi:hypothetical protein